MNGSLRAQCIAEFLGTGLFLFFGICCLSALKLTGASLGLWEILYYLGTRYFSGGLPDGRHFGGHLNPAVTVALWLFACFPGRKWCLYRGSGRRRVWRRRAGLDTSQHPVYAI